MNLPATIADQAIRDSLHRHAAAARRLSMLVDREVLERDNKRLKARLRFAGLRQTAAPEDVDYRAHRGLDRAMFERLITGPSGPAS